MNLEVNLDIKRGYKIFYAGSGGQDQEAIDFQNETCWKRIWGTDQQGLNGEIWVVYKEVVDLPKYLQNYARNKELVNAKETNFKIEFTKNNSYVVRSDSKCFGEQTITFESSDRTDCINYIASCMKQLKPSYYIVEDLSTWSNRNSINSKLESFETLDKAISKFLEYRIKDCNFKYIDEKAKTTLGVKIGTCELDIIQVRNNKNYLVSDFIGIPTVNTNKEFLSDIAKMSNIIEFDKINLRKNKYGEKLKEPMLIDFKNEINTYKVSYNESGIPRIDIINAENVMAAKTKIINIYSKSEIYFVEVKLLENQDKKINSKKKRELSL